ncbi:polymorphic toxin-type HINT domain-containing protein [Bythopirellula polymerisocia]|uniref:Hint domain-containing protein n=1 Tax=Bythopirellula polymerisocia TaxID=2528003 RepID=A0A5C6D000_9BACT|nr:polymorphic toxin-type HINT domain-containing protein [Bythopirellula polymerisocia]TWU28249.1 hypothetical protein Pla144_15360 [Bythopirellula polymerisocia]
MQSLVNSLFVIALQAILILASSAETRAEQSAHNLFRQALAADVQGDSAKRDQLLIEAERADPEFNLAHWYRGKVLFDGNWKPIDAVQQLVASDPRWDEYQTRLVESNDSLASQAALARWCRDESLTYEAKWHWFKVLSLDPNNREALGSLGLRSYKGQLLTDVQIDNYQKQEKQATADFKRYSKQFQNWIRAAAKGDVAERSEALHEFSSVSDPAAIPALMDAVFVNSQNEKLIRSNLDPSTEEQFLQGLRQSAVTALSEIQQHLATENLLLIAVEWSDPEISGAAAEALKYRERTSYMPQLMAALAAPVELAIAVNVLPSGEVTVFEDIAEESPLAELKVDRSSTFATKYSGRLGRNPRLTLTNSGGRPFQPLQGPTPHQYWNNRIRDYSNAVNQASSTQHRVASVNASRESKNRRIIEVAEIATGEQLGAEPRAVWDAWAQFNELDTPETLPVYQTSMVNDYTQYTTFPRTMSCFIAGTPVWTQAGPVAIETIQVGDMVLSQDPVTGELDFRPVTLTTVRKPSPTVELGLGSETIIATRGHRFWIAGDGWQMAKFLKAGDQLWAVGGAYLLDTAEPSSDAEAFNLEVGQFHTYFVGHSKVLVHDNRCPLPTTAVLPGVEKLPPLAQQ